MDSSSGAIPNHHATLTHHHQKWFSIGSHACGRVAIGITAHGIVAIGVCAHGIVSVGVISMGIFSAGLVSMGLVSTGVVAMGLTSLIKQNVEVVQPSNASTDSHHQHNLPAVHHH